MFGEGKKILPPVAPDIDCTIGSNIRHLREGLQLGQHEVATLVGLSVHRLARYEEGKERVPAAVLLELMRHFGCSLAHLFAGMPAFEAEAAFPGANPADMSPQPFSPADEAAGASAARDAAVVARIVHGFGELSNPALRQRLLSLLQALA